MSGRILMEDMTSPIRTGRLLAMLMELEIAASGPMSAQITACGIPVGQANREEIIDSRFALIARPHFRGSRHTIDGHQVSDDSARRIAGVDEVSGDGRRLHVHAGAVVDVIEMAP